MSVTFEQKERYGIRDLLEILKCLRAPGGCPWDREQTHQSIRTDFLEETYEAIEAINSGNDAALQEELGDVLLQVVFHAQIAAEDGAFDFEDVADGICKKLILRHPHVFGDVQAGTAGEVLRNWDAIKRKSKGGATQADLLRSVPHAMPALTRAAKVQNRAHRVGIDPPEAAEAAISRAQQALQAADGAEETEAAFGQLLFSLATLARQKGLDAELCLTRATDGFIARFAQAEQEMTQQGGGWADLSEQTARAVAEQAYL